MKFISRNNHGSRRASPGIQQGCSRSLWPSCLLRKEGRSSWTGLLVWVINNNIIAQFVSRWSCRMSPLGSPDATSLLWPRSRLCPELTGGDHMITWALSPIDFSVQDGIISTPCPSTAAWLLPSRWLPAFPPFSIFSTTTASPPTREQILSSSED